MRIVDAGGAAAINVQAVLDAEVFHIAQPGVDPAQCVVGRFGRAHTGFAGEAAALRCFHDQFRQPFSPAPIKPFGLCIFVDQALELAGVARKRTACQRRRQMADGDGGDAAFGLRGFARIADDERIDDRQRSGDDLGKAGACERHRFTRQPFERAVRAHMHKRVSARDMLQPEPECHQRMARR